MYAKALGLDAGYGGKTIESGDGGKTELVVTPVHKMYARVARVRLNDDQKVMVLDKTGNGSVTFFNMSDDGPVPDYGSGHGSEGVSTCEILQGVRDFAVIAIGNKVYVSGGYDLVDDCPVNALVMFDGFTSEWKLLSGMRKNRSSHTMVLWNNGLLVTGGEVNSSGSVSASCEFYDTESDKWTAIDNLPDGRMCHACVVHKDNVYVSGGLDPVRHPQTNLWVYDEDMGKWGSLDEDYPVVLPYRLAKHRMVSHYDSIYIVGGVSRKETESMRIKRPTARITSFKPEISYLGKGAVSKDINKTKYDRVTPWSHNHKPLAEPLYNCAVLGTGHNILVMGGCNDKSRNANLFTYDIENNSMKKRQLTTPGSTRGLPTNCDCVVIQRTRRNALEQLVQRNWPLW